LKLDEQAYRKQLSSSGKRYINKWKKANLEFVLATSEQREQFREIWYTTWYDKWFNVLPKEQFLKLREYCMSEEVWTLFLWVQNGKIVTGAVYLRYGKQMIYLYGGTDRSYGDIWAQYRLTDQIIRRWVDAKYTSLDLLGVAPVGFEKWHDRAGVTRFKQAFGGETISYWGSYDIVFNSWVR
jgi:lipid II:glycine glycyltransferase (peptidoglycan interpeptide bridge formation enzyme)